ncbi:hypothetical protein D1P53_004388 [Cryptococcus gattii VGV]|nr:hypothetical protein D1P53_004388 [Cryptococcus gattii VGV]
MASHLANIFGTEQDRMFKYMSEFDRKHIKPQFSQTILLPNVYNNPGHTPEGQNMSAEELQADFDRFYEDFFIELAKYGNLQEMIVCDNVGDHLLGNVYARFEYEAEAARAVQALNDRWYAMRPLHAELSPVTDFRESCCRQNELGECKREGSLVSALQASQRVSRRRAQKGAEVDSGDMGWTPAVAAGGEGDLGWMPERRY